MTASQVAPVSVRITKTSTPVTVSAAAGGAGQVIEDTTVSLYVAVKNIGSEDCEYKVDSGGWLPATRRKQTNSASPPSAR